MTKNNKNKVELLKGVISIELIKIKALNLDEIEPLVVESTKEGYRFVKRLRDEYAKAINRFDQPGEALFIFKIDLDIVGIGGINFDPYIRKEGHGRVRHLYVSEKYRGKGIGKTILRSIIDEAREHFSVLLLRTNNEIAERMYCDEGFTKGDKYKEASHYIELNK